MDAVSVVGEPEEKEGEQFCVHLRSNEKRIFLSKSQKILESTFEEMQHICDVVDAATKAET